MCLFFIYISFHAHFIGKYYIIEFNEEIEMEKETIFWKRKKTKQKYKQHKQNIGIIL